MKKYSKQEQTKHGNPQRHWRNRLAAADRKARTAAPRRTKKTARIDRAPRIGRAQWRHERNKRLTKREALAREAEKKEKKEIRKKDKALRRWQVHYPKPHTTISRKLNIQRPDKERFEALRAENASLAKKITSLKKLLTEHGIQTA